MGRVIMHAGMPKAGSSSVQRWVEAHTDLVRQHGIEPMTAHVDEAGDVVLLPHEQFGVSSAGFVKAYSQRGDAILVDRLAELLAQATRGRQSVLVSCEGFGQLIGRGDEPFIAALARLAQEREVHVAYYLRPQHTRMEAAWRQWGFRSGQSPSAYLGRSVSMLHYERTLADVGAAAPQVRFEMRPFRTDLLDRGNVVIDFAGRFLGIDELPAGSDDWWSNRGLSLDLANLLRYAPPGVFFRGQGDDPKYKRLKKIVDSWDVDDSPQVALSRLVLRAYCLDEFEAGNRELLTRLDWDTDEFVPSLDADALRSLQGYPADLVALDELWEPQASPVERELFYTALALAIRKRPRQNGRTGLKRLRRLTIRRGKARPANRARR